eukprot:8668882-Heterocapsa_arctica.AAC.1
MALGAEIVAAQEDAAAAEARITRESAVKNRSPDPERIQRRAMRSPSKSQERKESQEDPAAALEPVPEP